MTVARVIFVLFVTLVACINVLQASKLEIFHDDDLLSLIKSEKYVVVLFTKADCEACENYENELIHLREDLVDTLNAWVVKSVGSQLVRLYNPTKEPALVFFRHGVPLLYDGPINDEVILHTFTENKEPVVKELSDDNFEHLTQASSGATTGDWLIMFYSTDCVDCQRLQARWEAVGARLKTRMNVARVNRKIGGAVTGRRLGVTDAPTFLLLRQGKMYRYTIPKYDVGSFVAFATDWFKNSKMEVVPVPKSPFDDFTQMIADYLRENPWATYAGLGVFALTTLLALVLKFCGKKKVEKKSKKSK